MRPALRGLRGAPPSVLLRVGCFLFLFVVTLVAGCLRRFSVLPVSAAAPQVALPEDLKRSATLLFVFGRVAMPNSSRGFLTSQSVAPSSPNRSFSSCHIFQQDLPGLSLATTHRGTMPQVWQRQVVSRPRRPAPAFGSLLALGSAPAW